MNHTKHLIWMIIAMAALFAAAKITNTSFLIALSPLICAGMMLYMMVKMGANHDKKTKNPKGSTNAKSRQ